MKNKKYYIGINQYNEIFYLKHYPRKDLIEYFNCKNIHKMFVDSIDNKIFHIGYVIKGNWINIYEVIPMRKEIK